MNYEKKYKEALERAKEIYNRSDATEGGKIILESMFPELKESEDEKIRNLLIDIYTRAADTGGKIYAEGITYKQVIAWLEKQGENHIVENNEMVKSADNVEPKFKVGDWIVYEGLGTYKVVEIHEGWYSVIDINDYCWSLMFERESLCHIWTIEDAKDGDVICYKDEISLYKHDIKNCTKQETTFGGFVYYCCYDGKRFVIDSLYSLIEQDKMDIHPSTKEQRDLLFQKMKESGYEWDTENKELKKIELDETPIPCYEPKDSYCNGNCVDCVYKTTKCCQTNEEGGLFSEPDQKSVEIEHDETPTLKQNKSGVSSDVQLTEFEKEVKYLMNNYRGAIGDNDATIEEIKRYATYLLSLIHQNPAWSEDDEKMLDSIIDCIDGTGLLDFDQIDWLKSIKDKI